MKTPKISIIMPVYNTGKYLEESLQSVFAQTFKDFELICVNDASKDVLTLQILEKYKNAYLNMKVLRLEDRGGAGQARNYGFKEALGEYVIFLDADDIFAKELLEKMFDKIMEEDADVCICGCTAFSLENGKKEIIYEWEPDISKLENTMGEKYLLGWRMAPWNKLCKKSFLLEHNIYFQSLSSNNDIFFSVMIAESAVKKEYVTDRNLVEYRKNTPIQISANRNSCNVVYAIKLLKETMSKNNRLDEITEKQLVVYLIIDVLREMKRCKSDETNRKCYELVKDYLSNSRVRLSDKVLHQLCCNFMELPYDSRWHEKEFTLLEQLKLLSEELIKITGNRKHTFLWGSGKRGSAFQQLCKDKSISIYGVVDSKNINVGEDTEYGNKIFHTSQAVDMAELIIASNTEIYNYIKQITSDTEIINLQEFCSL